MRVAFAIAEGVVAAMNCRPENDGALRGERPHDCQNCLDGPGGLKGAVRKMTVEAHANADDVNGVHAAKKVNLYSADCGPPEQYPAGYQSQERYNDHPESDSPLQNLGIIGRHTYAAERSGVGSFT